MRRLRFEYLGHVAQVSVALRAQLVLEGVALLAVSCLKERHLFIIITRQDGIIINVKPIVRNVKTKE